MNEKLPIPNIECTRSRRGLTLIELMLVLAIMVVVAAFVLPTFKGPLANQKLLKAGDSLRAEWNRTRIRAMKSGRIQVFRAQIGTDNYTVQTWYAENDDVSSTNDSMKFGTAAPTPESDLTNRTLAEGIQFSAGDSTSDGRAATVEQQLGGGDSIWTRPILFYPDGTCSTAKFVLGDERQQYYVVVSLRGITGIAQMSDLVTAQEVNQ